jgi:site-specific DNA recombinase
LRQNGANGGEDVRDGYRALLKGLLFCGPCGCAMTHTYSQRGKTRYRYYVCLQAQKRGWNTCPSKSLPAAEIERFVVDHIRGVGRDPRVVAATVAEVRKQIEAAIAELETQGKRLTQEITACDQKLRHLIGDVNPKMGQCRKPDALAETQSRILDAQQRAREVRAELLQLKMQLVDEAEVKAGLAAFDPVWKSLSPGERARLLHLLIEKVVYDGGENAVSVTFRPTGIKNLAEVASKPEEDAA